MSKTTSKVAFCGVMAALSVVIMFLSGVVPVATIAIPAIAGCLLIPVVAECGVKSGWAVFAAVGVLSFFLATDREAFLVYVLFFGYYPILFANLDRIRNKALKIALKYIIFNFACVAEVMLAAWLFGIPFEFVEGLGIFTPVVLLAAANVVFFLYDRALPGLIVMYFHKFHKLVEKTFRTM